MIYFVILVLVNALALAIAVILTPGLDIQPLLPGVIDIGVTYLLIGVLIGLLNAFLKPVLLLFTARLMVRHTLLFTLIINTFLFWLLTLLVSGAFVIEFPPLLWIIWAGLIMALVLAVMEAVLALDVPGFRSTIETQYYWRWVKMLSTGQRNVIAENLRVIQATNIINEYTGDILVDMTPLARLRTFMRNLLFRDQAALSDRTLPEKVRYMLQDLGPTFVKFGQIVSSRAAELPPEWNEQLEKLQSNVPPFPYERARAIIIEELKDTPEKLYASFEQEPFAAASTAQVHKAVLHDGTPVVVKVQRPNIDVTVKADLNVLNDMSKQIQKKQDWAKTLDLHGLVDEFGKSILYELNYRNEATNIRLLTENMAQFDDVNIPAVYWDLTTEKVLTMEFVPGVKINDVARIKEAGLDPGAIVHGFVRAMTKQVMDGFFHADPHPGNVLVNLETGQIGFLDMGLMGEMNRMQRMALADALIAMVEGDGYGLGKAALHFSRPLPGVTLNEEEFLEAMERFGQRFLGVTESMSYSFVALQDMIQKFGLRIESSFTLAYKALMQADEIVRQLDPSINLSATALASGKVLLREQITSEAVTKTIQTQVSRTAREVAYRMPSLVDASTKWLDQYEKGRFSVHVDTSDLTPQVEQLDRALSKSMDRLMVALVLTGWLVGSAIASTVDVSLGTFRLSDLAFYMFLIGAAVGVVVTIQAITRLNQEIEEE
jgi:ubiquinone biosynthesis protein